MPDLANFKEQYPLNSRLAKVDGTLVEQVYRAGTPDGHIPPGLYAQYLSKANSFLEKAAAVADPPQAKVIRDLIRYYQSGDPKDWLTFGVDWVQNNEPVDFANGFIEVYRDVRGAKGTSQSFVSVTDERLNAMMAKIAANAQYFENKAPWAPQYRKQGVKPPLAKAVETTIETGDFHVTTVGDNLPNENEIHEKYGSKSFLFTGSSRAISRAIGKSVLDEFASSPEEAEIVKKYGEEAEAADAGAGQHPKYREAPEVPGQRGGRGRGEVQPQGRHEQLAAAEPVGQVSEQERARDRAGEIGAGDEPDLGRGEMQHRARFERAGDRAGDRHFEPVEDPGDAERDDDQRVEPRPRQPVEPGRNVGLDDHADIMHNRTTPGNGVQSRSEARQCRVSATVALASSSPTAKDQSRRDCLAPLAMTA